MFVEDYDLFYYNSQIFKFTYKWCLIYKCIRSLHKRFLHEMACNYEGPLRATAYQ